MVELHRDTERFRGASKYPNVRDLVSAITKALDEQPGQWFGLLLDPLHYSRCDLLDSTSDSRLACGQFGAVADLVVKGVPMWLHSPCK